MGHYPACLYDDLRSELKGDISDLRGLPYVVLAGIIVLIGFVIWDRRSAPCTLLRTPRQRSLITQRIKEKIEQSRQVKNESFISNRGPGFG